MEWLILLVVGGGVATVGRRLQHRRGERRERSAELDQVRRLAEEDITLLGEQLQRLDAAVAGRPLDDLARVDYQRALDAYESAQRATAGIREVDEISTVTDTLSLGRYAMVCVQARVDGAPVPAYRVPCFFNPQHGPSDRDVAWTRPGRGTRLVPACVQDAARVEADETPEVRYVQVGSRLVPYWEAGGAYAPYGRGYFVSDSAMGGGFGVLSAFEVHQPGTGDYWTSGHGYGSDGFGGSGFGGGFGDGGGGDGGGGGGD